MIDDRPIAVIEDSDEDFASLARALRGVAPPVPLIRYREAEGFLSDLEDACCGSGDPGWLVALLDLSLPGLPGWAVLERLRTDDRLGVFPVVVSGSGHRAGIESAYRLGARGYVVKPFDGRILAETMTAVVTYWRTVALPHVVRRKDVDG